MNWIDYRKSLGIGFDDDTKAEMLNNKIKIFLSGINDGINEVARKNPHISFDFTFKKYFYTVGELPYRGNFCMESVTRSITESKNISELVSKYVAFQNIALDYIEEPNFVDIIKKRLLTFLDELGIKYATIEDEDGLFIFHKGVPELDDALVSQPLAWLSEYPDSQKAWIKALKAYSEATDDDASDVADKFRKALETFFHEFFETDKSLENLKSEYGTYLKGHGVPSEISNNFETLLLAYTNFMNSCAKHHDKTQLNVLEYIMYQTGNIIRLLITLKDGEIE